MTENKKDKIPVDCTTFYYLNLNAIQLKINRCRVIGSSAFTGLSIYFLFERSRLPKGNVSQRVLLLGLSFTMAGVAIWRWNAE